MEHYTLSQEVIKFLNVYGLKDLIPLIENMVYRKEKIIHSRIKQFLSSTDGLQGICDIKYFNIDLMAYNYTKLFIEKYGIDCSSFVEKYGDYIRNTKISSSFTYFVKDLSFESFLTCYNHGLISVSYEDHMLRNLVGYYDIISNHKMCANGRNFSSFFYGLFLTLGAEDGFYEGGEEGFVKYLYERIRN